MIDISPIASDPRVDSLNDEAFYNSLSAVIEDILVQNVYNKISFYGYLLLTTQKEFVDKNNKYNVHTACLGIIDDKYKILINKHFWLSTLNMNNEKRIGSLVHEVLHSIYNHPLMIQQYSSPQLFNIAADLHINSVIIKDINPRALPGIHDSNEYNLKYKPIFDGLDGALKGKVITPEQYYAELRKYPIRPIHPDDYINQDKDLTIDNCINNGVDWIYNRLFNICQKNGDSDGSSMNFSDGFNHDNWDEIDQLDDGTKEFIKNQQEYYLKEILDSMDKSIGNVPGYLRELLNKILNPPKPAFNYLQYIRDWVGIFGNMTDVSRSRSKPHLIIPDGYRLKMKPGKYILICIDTSGSMSRKDLNEVLVEAYNIKQNTNCKIDVCEIDTDVNNIWELTSLEQMNKQLTTVGISGRGGTSFDPGVKYLNQSKKYSGLIYLTDGAVCEPNTVPNKPILTIVTSTGSALDWSNKGITCIQIPKDR